MDIEQLAQPDKGLISRSVFVDQKIYDLEMERLFGNSWLYLGHESEIPNPGDYLLTYMGEDSVVLWRDTAGELRAFLNTCQHKGMRLCRLDRGNEKFITCPYHGWTYNCQGNLIGVPDYKEAYFNELNKEDWGLIQVAQLKSYRGLVFANFSAKAPSLEDYLGGMRWYLDMVIDRTSNGLEVFRKVQRWKVKANWKYGSENFTDTYHVQIAHKSLFELKLVPVLPSKEIGIGVSFENGHGTHMNLMENPGGWNSLIDIATVKDVPYRGYLLQKLAETESRVGTDRSTLLNYTLGISGTIFPNFSFIHLPQYLIFRVWQPRGPMEMEIWSWCMVEKDMPLEVKEMAAQAIINDFSPSGLAEIDDTEIWNECAKGSNGRFAKQQMLNYQMGLGHEKTNSQELPGWIGQLPEPVFRVMPGREFENTRSEVCQRGFYKHWVSMMSGNGKE